MTGATDLWRTIADMESGISDIERWGMALTTMGTSENSVDTGAVYVVGHAIRDLGRLLREQFEEALEAAKKREASSCA